MEFIFSKGRVLRHIIRGGAAIAVMAVVAGSLVAASRLSGGFALNVYMPVSRALSGWLGVLFSFTRYSAAEFIICAFATAAAAALVLSAVFSVRRKSGWPLLRWLFDMTLAAAVTVFLFFVLWGCNYFAPKLEDRLSLRSGPQPEEVLLETARYHLGGVLYYAERVPRDGNGEADFGGFNALAPKAADSIRALGPIYPDLVKGTAVPPPKRVVAYAALARLGISGIYIPLTGECHVNTVNTDPFMPSTMCHELAHRLSFAPEEDANFIAYLACAASEYEEFRYSGALMAFTYCYNALSNAEYRRSLWAELPLTVIGDFERNREAWKPYEGPLREKAEQVNDGYLKAMGQADGVKSYGRVVDMLIALFLEETKQG